MPNLSKISSQILSQNPFARRGKFNQDRLKEIFSGRYAVCLKRRPSKAKIVNFK